jgi:hypothetical protein
MQEAEEATQANALAAEFQKGAKLYFAGRETYNTRKQSKGLDIIIRVVKALDALGSGRRDALLPLLDSSDVDVRVMAAVYSIKIVPERALALLKEIDDKGSGPTSMYAMTMLMAYNSGNNVGMIRPPETP